MRKSTKKCFKMVGFIFFIFCFFQWNSKKGSLEQQGSKIMDLLSKSLETSGESGLPGRGCIQQGYEMLEKRFDQTHGGFGNAPKFPQPSKLITPLP